jgi:hypothetical protein
VNGNKTNGRVLTFQQAKELYATRPRGRNSKELEPGIRLVRLSADRFGIQFKNTYLVRICDNGLFVLNTSGRPSNAALEVVNRFSPATVLRRGDQCVFVNGQPFKDGTVVNEQGEPVQDNITPFTTVQEAQ